MSDQPVENRDVNPLVLLDLTVNSSFKVKWRSAVFKGPKTHLLLVLEV